MTLEDPFFVVKDEVNKALAKTRGLYRRWLELQDALTSPAARDEFDWASTELRNALRSIEWDLEDLDDTICIVERNPTRFKIDNKELSNRRNFIDGTREEVRRMRDKMSGLAGKTRGGVMGSLLEPRVPPTHGSTKYSKLNNELDSPNRQFLDDTFSTQNRLYMEQDEQLELMSESMGTLKTVSRHIGSELDEQAVMLDEFGTDMENLDSKLDSTMKKIATALHLSNDRRQWIAIGVLSLTLFIIVVLLIVL